MPAKRRHTKRRTFTITPAALARWRQLGPDALTPGCVADNVLADMLDVPVLCAVAPDDMAELRAELERGEHRAD